MPEKETTTTSSAPVPPLPPGHLPRPRLIRLLDRAADSRLVVISGPAGSGKTALVSEWAGQCGAERLLWIRSDPSSSGAARAFETLAEQAGNHDSAGLRTVEIAAWLAVGDVPAMLVLDDVPQEDLAGLARFTAEYEGCRIIAITRASAPADLAVFRLQTTVAEIGPDDLAFTTEEIAELESALPEITGRLSAEDLRAATGGHALLTRVLLAGAPSSPEEAALTVAEWVERLVRPDLMQQALALTQSPIIDPPLAARITGLDDAAPLLSALVEDGFGERADDGSFRFHELIGAALRARADAVLPETERTRIRALAADHLRSVPEHAELTFDLLAQTQSLDDLWPHFASTFADSIPVQLEATLSALPAGILTSHAFAATIAAIARSASEPVPSRELPASIDAALDDLRTAPSGTATETGVFREVAVLALLWSAYRYEDGTRQAPIVLETARRSGTTASSPAWQAAYWGLLYATVMFAATADLDGAETLLNALEADRDARRVERRLIQRAFIHAMRGEIAQASRLIEGRTDVAGSPEWTARLTIARAAVILEGGDASTARALLAHLEPDLIKVPEWPYAIVVLSRTYIATDPVSGIENVDRLLRANRGRPIARGLREVLDSAVSDIALAAGEVSRAKKLVRGYPNRGPALRLAAARVALITADPRTVDDLRQLLQQGELWPRLRAQALLLLAVHEHRAGNSPSAQNALRRSLALTRGQSIRLIQSLVPHSELAAIASSAGVELPPNVHGTAPLDAVLSPPRLTRRERELLRHLARAATLRDIAEAEFVSLSTVKSQAASLYRKLGVSSRRDAVESARERGLLDPDHR